MIFHKRYLCGKHWLIIAKVDKRNIVFALSVSHEWYCSFIIFFIIDDDKFFFKILFWKTFLLNNSISIVFAKKRERPYISDRIYYVSNFNNVQDNLPISCATLTEFGMSSSCRATDISENSIHAILVRFSSLDPELGRFIGTKIPWKIK